MTMDQGKVEALLTEFVHRVMSEAGAKVGQCIAVRLASANLASVASVSGVLFSENKEAIDDLDFVSKSSHLPLEISDIFPLRPRTQGHRFIEGGGEVIKDGKESHPDFLRVYIKRDDAFTFAMNILRQLEHPRPDANPLLEIPLFGKLERVPEDDL